MEDSLVQAIYALEKKIYRADALDVMTIKDSKWCVLHDGPILIAYVLYGDNYICSLGVHAEYSKHKYGLAVLQYLMINEPDMAFEIHINPRQQWWRSILRCAGFQQNVLRVGELLYMSGDASVCFEQKENITPKQSDKQTEDQTTELKTPRQRTVSYWLGWGIFFFATLPFWSYTQFLSKK